MICAAFNVAVLDDDTDGNATVKKVTEHQATLLSSIAAPLGDAVEEKFFGWVSEIAKHKVTTYSEIPASRFQEVHDQLQRKVAKMGAEK